MTTSVAISKIGFKDGHARSFHTKIRGINFYGLVIKKGGSFFVYRNLCQHLPVTLDLNDNDFFNHEKTHLQCHMHGAVYEIETGRCIEGPCVGANLAPLDFVEESQRLIVQIPHALIRHEKHTK